MGYHRSEEGDSLSGEEEGLSEVGCNMNEKGDKPSVDGDRLAAKNGRAVCPSSLDSTPVQSTVPVCTPPILLPAPPPQGGGRVQLHSVVGYSGNQQHNLVWHPLRGLCGLGGAIT